MLEDDPMRRPLTVLVVDDNPVNTGVLFDLLQAEGYRVLAAESGDSALSRVRRRAPDLILLDVMMPGIDGFETCRRIKDMPGQAETPVIFMTALDDMASKLQAFAGGAVDYITKPFQREELLARVRTHLNLAVLRAELRAHIVQKDEAITELDAFSHTVAHDLKNPLAAMIGLADCLRDDYGELTEAARLEVVRMLLERARDAKNLVDELLTLSSVRQEPVERGRVDPLASLRVAMDRLDHMARERGAELSVPACLPAAIGYHGWLVEVWMNYLSNAMKYGGNPPRVEIGADDLGDGLRFWVADNGPGVPDHKKSQVFQPFNRIAQIRAEGSGLGLSIVRRIMDQLEGQAGFMERPDGRNAAFFILPAAEVLA